MTESRHFTQRVEECISAVMAKHHGTSERALGKYFEEVHQYLAPLARNLEREINLLRKALDTIARTSDDPAMATRAKRALTPNVQVQRDSGGIIAGGSAGTTG